MVEDKIVTTGINSKGHKIEFDKSFNDHLYCQNEGEICLVSLDVSSDVRHLYCNENELSELVIPEGVLRVYCYSNNITELNLPSSLEYLYCDKTVKGLSEYIGKVNMILY